MSTRANATAVGAFVLGAIAIAVGIVVVFGAGLLDRHAVRFVVYFDGSLEGLAVGAPVKYRGVQVGEVVAITPILSPHLSSVDVPVIIELHRDAVVGARGEDNALPDLITAGLRARLELASLITGQLFVGLDIYPDTPIVEVQNTTGLPQIPSIPSLQYGMQQTLSDLLADRPKLEKGLNQMLELLDIMVADGGMQQVTETMKAATVLVDRLSQPDGPLFKTLDALPPVLEQVGKVAAAAPPLLDKTGQALDSVNGLVGAQSGAVPKTLADVDGTLADLRKLMEQLTLLVGQVRAPVAGFAQTGLPNLQGLIQDMDRTVGEISRTVRDLRQDPARFLLGNTAAEGVKLK